MPHNKKNALEALQRDEGDNRNPYQGETMNTIQPQHADKLSSAFSIATTHARISVGSEREYWADNALPDVVRLTDDSESHMLLTPAEALSVAAALQAVAVHLIRRSTEAGNPSFEEAL